METSAIFPMSSMPVSNETVNLLDLLRVIGMKEVANNVFSLPSKKKK
jgi:hypothetical protein